MGRRGSQVGPAVRMRWAIDSRACVCPITRSPIFSSGSAPSDLVQDHLPDGTPVHAATTSAMACPLTNGCTSG